MCLQFYKVILILKIEEGDKSVKSMLYTWFKVEVIELKNHRVTAESHPIFHLEINRTVGTWV